MRRTYANIETSWSGLLSWIAGGSCDYRFNKYDPKQWGIANVVSPERTGYVFVTLFKDSNEIEIVDFTEPTK